MTAFLFDNDGVLIDTSELHWRSWQLLMQEDPSFSMTKEQFKQGFGKTNTLILNELCPQASQEQKYYWALRKEEHFRQLALDEVEMIQGMEHFLAEVVERKIPHIIASSTPRKNLELFLQTTPLGKYFEHSISGEEVQHGKPAPDIFIAAAKQLGFEPSECVVFEDAPAGLIAARAAGCFVVALETSHSKEALPTYDLIYSSPADLDLDEILLKKEQKIYTGGHGD